MDERPRRRRRVEAAEPLLLPAHDKAPRDVSSGGTRWWWWGGTGLNLLAGLHCLQVRAAAAGRTTVGCVVSGSRPAPSAQRYAHLQRLLAAAADAAAPTASIQSHGADRRAAAIADVPIGCASLVWERCSSDPSRRTLRCPTQFWHRLREAVVARSWVVVPLYLVGQFPVALQRDELLRQRTVAEVDECHVTMLVVDCRRKRYALAH